jgi:hypothetical protein
MAEHKVGLLLRTVFLPPLDENSLAGNEVAKVYDDDPDFADVSNPVENFVNKAAEDHLKKGAAGALVDISWDQPFAAPREKRAEPFTNPLNFSKGSMGYKLKITRVEEKMIDGEKWNYSYAGDDLVDARVVNE